MPIDILVRDVLAHLENKTEGGMHITCYRVGRRKVLFSI